MPSYKQLLKASVSLGSLGSNIPDSVSLTGTSGNQLLGYFSGWTSKLSLSTSDCDGFSFKSLLTPLTVFTSTQEPVTCDWVQSQVETYKTHDDVYEESFMKTVYLQGGSSYNNDISSCLAQVYGTELVFFDEESSQKYAIVCNDTIPRGPYIAYMAGSDITLGPVYRVYHDELQAFMNGILPNGTDGAYRYAGVNTMSDATVGIPVPSRLYSANTTTESRPFEGLRVTVKDIIDIKGIKTTNGNRAWAKLYEAANATAPVVQRLVDMGATLIGKTKTSQFANSDRVTADWVDYHDAFNPRGDGYQDTGVSSAGAGAATAGYDWVDVSICTDTGGSIRIPASKQGVFALRPSFGATSNDGVMLEGQYFDAVGYHTRSPYTLQSFGKAWLADSNLTDGYTAFPRKLIVPGNLFPVAKNASQAVYGAWIDKLADHLNATIVTTSIGEFWNTTANKPGTEFFSYMQMVAANLNWKNQVEKVIDPFKADYAAKFGGRQPFINPYPAARYATVINTTDEDVEESYERLMFFKKWFGENVVKASEETCSESLFLIPMFAGEESYRNTVYSPPNVSSWSAFLMYYYSTQSQGPETVFPIGEVPYFSNITYMEEKLPVSIDVLAHKDCDLMLLDLAKDLADSGLLEEVKTGSTLW
ncbi:hypothetical protein PFICI_06949 [Pestalotiopsis fici W106-1]|uniref:Uncharacterized protein n=1 Tax=Pestalotiopsis fici (strain W106-1 / CGMCC3.15140) TaxID=1229662 RepID=W3X972_PESFW|nr:uncharacterized protein PFICI_06949 [Pestalotiopsis fici W106-1]ETS81947.1 hypothetical protein PFICI_06949 [Pestalotiopsis fici W106-1]